MAATSHQQNGSSGYLVLHVVPGLGPTAELIHPRVGSGVEDRVAAAGSNPRQAKAKMTGLLAFFVISERNEGFISEKWSDVSPKIAKSSLIFALKSSYVRKKDVQMGQMQAEKIKKLQKRHRYLQNLTLGRFFDRS